VTAADAMAAADAAVVRALEPELRTADDMREAVSALGEAFTAVGDAHRTIIDEARALGATERTDSDEVDGMLAQLTALWSARFGGGDTDATVAAPAMFAVAWEADAPAPADERVEAIDARASALLDAWTTRTEAWRALAALERRSLAALDALRARQRDYAARFAAAKAASIAVPVLQALRDELVGVLRRLAEEPGSVPRPEWSSARRRAGAGLAEATKLVDAHGTIPGLAETAHALAEAFRLILDGLTSVTPRR